MQTCFFPNKVSGGMGMVWVSDTCVGLETKHAFAVHVKDAALLASLVMITVPEKCTHPPHVDVLIMRHTGI
jgi:hypothetical protein